VTLSYWHLVPHHLPSSAVYLFFNVNNINQNLIPFSFLAFQDFKVWKEKSKPLTQVERYEITYYQSAAL